MMLQLFCTLTEVSKIISVFSDASIGLVLAASLTLTCVGVDQQMAAAALWGQCGAVIST